ncbi:hypothetical protein HK102_000179 [Quaeritorhiza haematococci]|nr:hypothetical protein HK102_000179 [Quaeritorhiza haematococci]
MHELCARTKWARFHGTNTEWDFVEAPSQMLENWCWEAEVLRRLSGHWEDRARKIPDELVEKLVKSKNVNAGLLTLRQVFFGTFDMTVHTLTNTDGLDTTSLWSKLREEVSLIPSAPGTHPASSFGHIMSSYDAGYYGYLWSEVFSADMFVSRFKKEEAIQNSVVGKQYREKVLGPGGSKDGMDLLESFLGRSPTQDAFLERLGLGNAATSA